jgi:hypothetical protein
MDPFFATTLGLIEALLFIPFRAVDHPLIGFFLGSTCLAMATVVLGELVLSLAIRFNRSHLQALTAEVVHHEALSVRAYGEGDKTSYKALNKAANDAWGRHFFTMAAYSAGMLFPVPFALAWMQAHFHGVAFLMGWPLNFIFGRTVSYPFIFILTYILCRILFKYMRPYLPYFKNVQIMLDTPRNVEGPKTATS